MELESGSPSVDRCGSRGRAGWMPHHSSGRRAHRRAAAGVDRFRLGPCGWIRRSCSEPSSSSTEFNELELVSRVGIEPTTRRLRAAARRGSDRSRPRSIGVGCFLIGATDCRSQPFGAPCSRDPLHGATRREPIVAVRGAMFWGSVARCNEKRARVGPRQKSGRASQPAGRARSGRSNQRGCLTV